MTIITVMIIIIIITTTIIIIIISLLLKLIDLIWSRNIEVSSELALLYYSH